MSQDKYKISKTFRFLVLIILGIANKIFKIKPKMSDEVKNLSGPYLLLSNHIGTYDPFIIGNFFKKTPHFVSSDAVFRDPFLGYIVRKFGTIPKKKNLRDTQVIRDMLSITQNGGAIGLFPEGSRSWTGTSLPIEPSIAKLIKLLNVPVVTARMKGMHLTNPRWAFKLRRASIDIEYELSFSQEAIQNASIEEILKKVRKDIYHDEVDFQRQAKKVINSRHRAEYINYVLFYCPSCKSIGKIKAQQNEFECTSCGNKHHVNQYGFFELLKGDQRHFDNIRDWFTWQREAFENFVEGHFRKKTFAPLFEDHNMRIHIEADQKFTLIGEASMYFYINRILIKFENGKQMEFRIEDIQTMNPQLRERIEVFHKGQAYRITSKTPGISGLKWEFATNAIWQMTGQEFKQSTYLAK